MTDPNFFLNLTLALALGALVGIEREKSKQEKREMSTGGVRTMVIVSLFGAISAFYGQQYNPWVFLISFIGIVLFIAISHAFFVFRKKLVGITTEVSVVFVFLLGALVMTGYTKIAFVIGVVMALVLSLRQPLHRFIKRMSSLELLDTIKFALIAFVILPLLPNYAIDPWGLFNPYTIWLFVVIFSAISFLGYVLSKLIGTKRGINVTAFLAGLLSSTAMVSNIGKRVRGLKINLSPFVTAALIAYLGSFIPTIVEIFALNIPLFKTILPSMLVVVGIGVIFVLFIMFGKDFQKAPPSEGPKLRSPFSLSSALEFGLLLVTINTLAVLGSRHLGDVGIYITSVISGFASMDAITLSMAGMGGETIPLNIAARAVLIGLSVSAISKITFLGIFGKLPIAKRAAPYFIILCASLIVVSFVML